MLNMPPLADVSFDLEEGPLEPVTAVVRQFYDHWLNQAQVAGGLPVRDSIDPLEIAPCLPYCMIYRRVRVGEGFECLLCGESINAAWGRNLRGARTREMFTPREMDLLHARWNFLLE